MAAAAKKQQQPPAAAAGAGEPAVVDPKFEWAEKAGSYVLRLVLPGFRKDDFRVLVDGAGRLTVRGTRTGTAGPGSLCKVFQLPAGASHDDIAGRFEAGVLTLTVPKRAAANAGVPAPTSIEEIKRKQPSAAKEEGATGAGEKGDAGMKKIGAKEEDALRKAMDEATSKPQEKKMQEEVEEAKPRKQEQHKPAPSPSPVKKEEDVKPKAPQAAAAAPSEKPAPATGTVTDKAKAVIAPDSLAERVRQRGEEEQRAKAAAAAADKEVSTQCAFVRSLDGLSPGGGGNPDFVRSLENLS